MSVVNLTTENFENEVLNSEKPVLVDFFATWCGPCKMVSPIIDQIAEENTEIKVCKINVDEQTHLAQRYSVASIPTIMVFKNGSVVKSEVGAKSKTAILAMLD